MKKQRQYAVEVLSKYSHGKYGKTFYFGFYLYGFSKTDAENVAAETLAEMTFPEISKRCVDCGKPWETFDYSRKDEKIGFDMVDKYFSFKAYIE